MANKNKKREYYYHRLSVWQDSEPSKWRVVSWIRWRFQKPKKPKWLDEFEEKRRRWTR